MPETLGTEKVKQAVDLINYADPDSSGQHIVLADDLLAGAFGPSPNLSRFRQSAEALAEILADESISNADLKGLLNRASAKMWGAEYERRFTPREFLEELKAAIEKYVRRKGGVR